MSQIRINQGSWAFDPMMRKINSYLDGIGLGSASDGEAKGKEASLALKGAHFKSCYCPSC